MLDLGEGAVGDVSSYSKVGRIGENRIGRDLVDGRKGVPICCEAWVRRVEGSAMYSEQRTSAEGMNDTCIQQQETGQIVYGQACLANERLMSWLLCLRKLVDGVRMEAGRKKEELRANVKLI